MSSPLSSPTSRAYPQVPMQLQAQAQALPLNAASSARSEHIDDVDAVHVRQQDVLISHWSSPQNTTSSVRLSPYSTPRPQQLALAHTSSVDTPVILQFKNTHTSKNVVQDARLQLSDESHSSLATAVSTPYHQDVHCLRPLESHALPSAVSIQGLPHDAPLNAFNPRLRTNLPVFPNATDLAAHYGIPRKLPPTPRVQTSVNKYKSSAPSPILAPQQPPVPRFNESPEDPTSQLQNLINGYIGMLNTPPEETANTASAVSQSPAMNSYSMGPSVEEAAQNVASLFVTDGEVPAYYGFSDFLTSPLIDDESPLEGNLDTPGTGFALNDFLMSPLVAESSSSPTFTELPLFARTQTVAVGDLMHHPSKSIPPQATSHLEQPDFESMLRLSPVPPTPVLEPSSASTSPMLTDVSELAKNHHRGKRAPTGTRKNATPESLVPLDAPTQSRHYATPSATSRKDLPAVFARKRLRSEALGDEEDELAEDASELRMTPSATEAEAITAKRRQNTLAARRSRKRKLEYQKQLEDELETVKREREIWKQRALIVRGQLMAIGLPEPFGET